MCFLDVAIKSIATSLNRSLHLLSEMSGFPQHLKIVHNLAIFYLRHYLQP
ncbi:hypothetical protein P8921_30 [Streptococcus phage P8921]|nr:hypothetical protein P8921_30 [Streptococcus phage P8921]